jgi:hypothetical protein
VYSNYPIARCNRELCQEPQLTETLIVRPQSQDAHEDVSDYTVNADAAEV